MHQGLPSFKGLRITQDVAAWVRYPALQWVLCDRHREDLVLDKPGQIGWGGNSGFHALNLAVQFGAKKIILVGYDMHLNAGIHWHGPHEKINNPTSHNVKRWRKAVDDVAPVLVKHGVKVINASLISALQNYPKMTFEQALLA